MMRINTPREVIEDMVWVEIYKLAPKLDDLFWIPMRDIVLIIPWFAGSVLGCSQLHNIMDTLEVWVSREGNIMWWNNLQASKGEIGDALSNLTGKQIDRILGFRKHRFDRECIDQGVDPNDCHILLPMHVHPDFTDSLDQTKVMNADDWHTYFTREYLISYSAQRIQWLLWDPQKFAKLKYKPFWTEN